jgi:hypothetical protein
MSLVQAEKSLNNYNVLTWRWYMTNGQQIFNTYKQMRANGVEPKAALDQLRQTISGLPAPERQQLARFINAHETGQQIPAMQPRVVAPISAQPVGGIPGEVRSKPVIKQLKIQSSPERMDCPHCGKSNRKDEVLCTACGNLLHPEQDLGSTRALLEADELFFTQEYFGPDSVLSLQVRGTVDASINDTYQLRPQDYTRETIIGRSTNGNTIAPDIDLTVHRAEQRGVSRLHLSIQYDEKHHNVTVTDLNSANGSFINGQRLHPNEVRILRNGDELRIGKLVLMVSFYHITGFNEGDFA